MSSTNEMEIDQLEPSIREFFNNQAAVSQINSIIDNIKEDEPMLDEDVERKYLLPFETPSDYTNQFINDLFHPTTASPEWDKKYKKEQKKIKRQDREKLNYESQSTSEDAKIGNLGNVLITIKEEAKYCQWSPHNKLQHILYGKKGVIDISTTFKGIPFNPLVEEYFVRVVLIRANIQHRQYPVECVCLQHQGPSNGPDEDRHQVLQAKPGTSLDKFWYTYDGLRKSVIFEAPRPDHSGEIKVHMNLVCLCCDSCEAASDKYQKLINSAGKEASRDWLLVTTLESRMNERQTVLARDVVPCWFKASVNQRDLLKTVRRKEKGGGAQKAHRLKRIAENLATETDGKKPCKGQSDLDTFLLSTPPEGKKHFAPSNDLTIAHSVLSQPFHDEMLQTGPSPDHDYFKLSFPVVTMDSNFHVKHLKELMRSGQITEEQLKKDLFG